MATYYQRASFLLCSFLIVAACSAQAGKLKTKVVLAPDAASIDKRPIGTVIDLNDRSLFVMRLDEQPSGILRYADAVPQFELYDRAKLGVVRTQTPQPRLGSDPLFFETVVLLGNDPVMIASRRDTVLGITQLYWQKTDPNLTTGHRPFELLCAFDTKTYGDGTKLKADEGYHDPFHAVYAPDRNHVLLYSPAVKSVKGETYCPMVMVDRNMKVVWKQTLELPDGARFQDVTVDILGNALFMERNSKIMTDMKKDTTSYTLVMHRVNGDGVVDVDLGLGKVRFAKNVVYRSMPDSTLLIAGLYSGSTGSEEPTLGEFLGKWSPVTSKFEKITTSTLALDAEDRAPTNNAIRIIDILPRSDGGYFLVREYFQETDAIDAKTAMAGLRWIHGPVVVSSLDANGKETWNETFRRLLYTTDKEVGEVFSAVYKDQLVLVLIDNDEQVEKRKAGNKKLNYLDVKSPFSTTVIFDEKGAYKAKAILRSSGANDFIVGRRMYQFGPQEYYLSGSHKMNSSRTLPVRMDLSVD